jgi:hypothetical protein
MLEWYLLSLTCSVQTLIVVWVDLCQLSEEGPCEDLSGDGQLSTFNEWILPAKEFDGMWERFVCRF